MSNELDRRTLLTRAWKSGFALIAAAGGWTTWGVLKPKVTSGFGGLVRAVAPDVVPETGVIAVPAAHGYLTRIDGKVVALNEKCTHLGCKVPFCDSSGQFECPCHGSVFNRAGEWRAGPAPRGMDRYPVSEGEDGLLYIDTGSIEDGPPQGDETIDEPPAGPICASESAS